MPRDYYDILGAPKNASQDQIKKAYREQVLKHHPDVSKDPKSEAKMRELNEAYAVLGDPDKRRQYDAYGPEQFGRTFSEEDIFRGFNPEDMFRDLFGFSGFGEEFGDLFSRGGGGMGGGEQSGVNLYLSFDDLEKGVDREFEVQHYKPCPNCRGNGAEPGSKVTTCDKCNGSRQVRTTRRTPFGIMQTITTCDKCRGSGKIYEKLCRVCKGNGRVIATDRFRIKAERADKEGGSTGEPGKRRFFVF